MLPKKEKIMNCKLSKRNENCGIRTKEVIGQCQDIPKIGSTFFMQAEPLSELGSFRIIETSKVTSIRGEPIFGMEFTTESGSEYHFEIVV